MQKPRAIKLSVSLPEDMARWLKKRCFVSRVTVSAEIKQALLPAFQARRKA